MHAVCDHSWVMKRYMDQENLVDFLPTMFIQLLANTTPPLARRQQPCFCVHAEHIAYSSLKDEARIEALLEKSMTNNPMQQRTPTLEIIKGDNDIVHISFWSGIFDLLESAFPDGGGWLLPPDPEARARVRKVVEAINSVIQNGGATWSISMRNIEVNCHASRHPWQYTPRRANHSRSEHMSRISQTLAWYPSSCMTGGDSGSIPALTPHRRKLNWGVRTALGFVKQLRNQSGGLKRSWRHRSSTRKDLPMSKEGTMDFDLKRLNRIVEKSKLRELVTSHHCHYYLQLLVRIRLKHII